MMTPARDLHSLGELATEAVDPAFSRIDMMSVGEAAALMNEADATVPAAIAAAMDQIVPAIEAAAVRMKAGGRLLYVGSGTPGRIGVLDASECPPTFGTSPELVRGIIAGGDGAITTAVEGAEDDPIAGADAMMTIDVGPGDTVIGITSSGRTPYVLGALGRARELGALTIGLACNRNAATSTAAELPIEVIVGPEIISGSTRLKSGTAQKLVLNMFSTLIMVQLGKTYGNLMVDVLSTNDKLVERAIRIVRTITGCDRESASAALGATDFNVKLAVIRVTHGVDTDTAVTLLADAGGHLRGALEGAK